MPHALLVEDDRSSLESLAELVEQEGFSVDRAMSLATAWGCMRERRPDLLLVDLMLPDGEGLELLQSEEMAPAGDVVLITGHASVDTAVEALRGGVADYLTKPIDIGRLRAVLANVARRVELADEVQALREELRKLGRFGSLIGASPQMERLYDLIERVAPTEATVLITGESGTGKDLVAQTIHELSRRRRGPFLPLNCGAISPQLIESELFGHERGSFTGADRQHRGYFERASGGTLFLDEITEMPLELQVKLLRVLETGSLLRIGGEEPIAVNVRVLAATNRSPQDAVAAGRFREDLLYRLRVFPIALPPLWEREGDVERLAEHFLQELNEAEGTSKRLHPDTLTLLKAYAWPGNVRELRNVVHHAFILADRDITPDCLTPEVAGGAPEAAVAEGGAVLRLRVGASLAEAERRLILATLDQTGGDKTRAAQVLGVSVKTLYNRINSYKSTA